MGQIKRVDPFFKIQWVVLEENGQVRSTVHIMTNHSCCDIVAVCYRFAPILRAGKYVPSQVMDRNRKRSFYVAILFSVALHCCSVGNRTLAYMANLITVTGSPTVFAHLWLIIVNWTSSWTTIHTQFVLQPNSRCDVPEQSQPAVICAQVKLDWP